MGRNLGYFDSDELDRPELNKCPDCECYFSSEECPLCGKICPEEMRAGNRAAVKKPKNRRNSTGRVQFISWYHSWWFIFLMLYIFPIAGIILFFTSPHSKKSKIIVGCVVAGIYVLFLALWLGLFHFFGVGDSVVVDDSITKEEYVERCEPMTVEQFYRNAYDNEGAYITLDVVVVERLTESSLDVYDQPTVSTYYRCRSANGGIVEIFIGDCNLEKQTNYLPGDRLRVYGEGGGMISVWQEDYTFTDELPCLYMAYCEPLRETGAEKETLFLPLRGAEALA